MKTKLNKYKQNFRRTTDDYSSTSYKNWCWGSVLALGCEKQKFQNLVGIQWKQLRTEKILIAKPSSQNVRICTPLKMERYQIGIDVLLVSLIRN